jgi:hypothetical protein
MPEKQTTFFTINCAENLESPNQCDEGKLDCGKETTILCLKINNWCQASIGLSSAIVLAILCITFMGIPSASKYPSDGTGLLHNIWLWCNHPNAPQVLKPIKTPTGIGLRTAGLITLQLSSWKINKECPSPIVKISQNDHLCANNSLPTLPRANEGIVCHISCIYMHTGSSTDSLPSVHWHNRIVSILMHVLLIVAHVSLLVLGVAQKEHTVVFSTHHQHAVSFWYTVGAQAFGTV